MEHMDIEKMTRSSRGLRSRMSSVSIPDVLLHSNLRRALLLTSLLHSEAK